MSCDLQSCMRISRVRVSRCVFNRDGHASDVYRSVTLGSVLLASAVRIAQTLRIDQLADDDWCESDRAIQQSCALHGIAEPHFVADSDVKEREIRRRLWWFLLYRDWRVVVHLLYRIESLRK
jgi:hypothetical protein